MTPTTHLNLVLAAWEAAVAMALD